MKEMPSMMVLYLPAMARTEVEKEEDPGRRAIEARISGTIRRGVR